MSARRHIYRRLLATAILIGAASTALAQSALLQTPSRSFPTGNQVVDDAHRPEHTACADMDGDGDLDLVIAQAGNIDEPKVSVMFNQGDGTYGAPVNYDAPGQTMEVAVADLDGDGDIDAAFAQSHNGSAGSRVLVYKNTGNGTLFPYVSYTVGTGPTGIVAVDVDLDGDIDLVTANSFWLQEDVTVLYNNGNGNFPNRADFAIPGENPLKVAAGDLTGDGAPELVVNVDDGEPAIAVLTNNGSGSFSAPEPYSTGLASFYDADVAVADVDLDGDNDVLYGTSTNGGAGYENGFALFRNAGGGTLAAFESIPLGENFAVLNDLAVADVTGDGWPDVLGTERLGYEGFVLLPGDGAGGFGAPTGYCAGEYSRAVTTADVDGDGDLDAVVTNHASLTVTVHENDGAGFSKPPALPLGQYIEETAAGDIDGDGDIDLLTSDWDGFLALVNQGDGDFIVSAQPSPGTKRYTKLRDIDGDGDLDVIFGGLARALNDGAGNFGPVAAFPVNDASDDVETLDMDNDGDLDAVVAHSSLTQGGFSLFENVGNGNYGPATFFGTQQYVLAGRIVTGDFDEDGKQDVVTARWQTVWFWAGSGNGDFAAPIPRDLAPGGAAYLIRADLDGDGHLDLAGSHWGADPEGETLTIVFGSGDGTFTEPVTYLAMFSQWKGGLGGLTTADVDGDGDLDLIGGARAAEDVAVFLNHGNRTFAPEQRFGVDGDVEWVAAGDFDGDGKADVAANFVNSSPEGGGIAILPTEPSPFQNLGLGLAGSVGVPLLIGSGSPDAFQFIVYDLSRAAASAPSFLVLSPTHVNLPLFGGTLVPAPDILLPFVTTVDGGFTFQGTWPAGLPAGTKFTMQTWITDPLAATGVSASNAIQTTQAE